MLLLVATVIMVVGCQKTVVERVVDQYYQVNYIKPDNRAIVSASVQINGRSVSFTDRTTLTANGLAYVAPYGTNDDYLSWVIYDTNSVTFRLKKTDNSEIVNTVDRSSIEDISIVVDSVLSVSDTMKLSFLGAGIGAGEYVAMSMNRNSDSTGLWSGTSAEFAGKECTTGLLRDTQFLPGKIHNTPG